MKRPLPLLLGLLALYILGSSFWYANSACCAGSAAAAAATESTTMVEQAAPAAAAAAAVEETGVAATADAAAAGLTIEERLRASNLILYFDSNSEQLDLDDEQRNYLGDLYTYLRENEATGISVVGHTDSEGDASNNQVISQNRADLVRNYLIGNGIRPEQIEAKGMGAEEPIASNDTEEGKATNRRVEIILN